jgi:hypothetical protein
MKKARGFFDSFGLTLSAGKVNLATVEELRRMKG